MLKIKDNTGSKVTITGSKFYKGRTGTIKDIINYNDELLYVVLLDNFNGISLSFKEGEIKWI